MADLLSRHQQILMILRDHPKGLDNKTILSIGLKMRGNELPNDQTQMAVNTQNLRRRDFLTTADTISGKIHSITQKGLDALAESLGQKSQAMTEQQQPHEEPKMDSEKIANMETDQPAQPMPTFSDYIDVIEQSAKNLREASLIINAMAPTPKIDDKQRKIAVLEHLENSPLFCPSIKDMLGAIRRDLEQIDAE